MTGSREIGNLLNIVRSAHRVRSGREPFDYRLSGPEACVVADDRRLVNVRVRDVEPADY